MPRLFESLQQQTDKCFEWIIIDDDSTDDAENLVEGFISADNAFSFIYEKWRHGGKHRAINMVCS